MSVLTGSWLDSVRVDPEVWALRPDYRALVMVADGLRAGPSDAGSDGLLARGVERARAALGGRAVEEHPHVAAWRDAFRAFGAKPQRTRPSVEGLLRRLDAVPRLDRLTDAYNAVSIGHVVPVGGEDLARYQGALRLVRATGEETFDTTAGGEPVVEAPAPGEVVWRDDEGVTCRRWNWRQCVRTRITQGTTRGVFLLDALSDMDDDALRAAGQALTVALRATSPDAEITTRLIRP